MTRSAQIPEKSLKSTSSVGNPVVKRLFVSAAALALLLCMFNTVQGAADDAPLILRCGMNYPFTTNPLNADDNSWKVLGQIYEGATKRHPETGELIPYIAVGSANESDGSSLSWSDCAVGNFGYSPRSTWKDASKPEVVVFYDFTNVRFHDGHQMDIRDIMFSLHVHAPAEDARLGNPVMDRGGVASSNYSETHWLFIQKVWESEDSFRAALRFVLQRPFYSVFEDYLSSYILPYHIWGNWMSNQFTDATMIWCDPGYDRSDSNSWKDWAAERWGNPWPVGSGPFMWSGSGENSITLTKWSDHFYRPGFKYGSYESFAPAQPMIDGIYYLFYLSDASAISDLMNDKLDLIAWGQEPSQIAQFTNDPDIGIKTLTSTEMGYLGFNMRRESFGYKLSGITLVDAGKPLRKALAHCIDLAYINSISNIMMSNDGQAGTFSKWENATSPRYNFDPAEAINILKNAGYKLTNASLPPGNGTWWLNPDGTNIGSGFGGKVQLLVPLASQDLIGSRVGNLLADQLTAVGLNTEAIPLERTMLEQRISQRDFDLFISDQQFSALYRERPENFLFRYFDSSNIYEGENYFGYWNTTMDRSISAAMATSDRVLERRSVRDAMATLAYDVPYISLRHSSNIEIYRSDNFQGLADDGSGTLMNPACMASIRMQDKEALRARFLSMPLTMIANYTFPIQVKVTDRSGDPVMGAAVMLECTIGELLVTHGITDVNGILKTNYTAPRVMPTGQNNGTFAMITIKSATAEGFRDAMERYALIIVYPEDAMPLLVKTAVDQDVVPDASPSGSPYMLYMDVLVTDPNNIPVEGATISLNLTGIGMSAALQSAITDRDGTTRVMLTTSKVEDTEENLITVTASKRSYLNGTQQTSVFVVPAQFGGGAVQEPDGGVPAIYIGLPLAAAIIIAVYLIGRKKRRK